VKPIYLDYNATTPIDGRVVEAMLPYITDHFGNPSSAHAYGVAARKAVDEARSRVAGMLGCEVFEVVFTCGGSESNNHAITGVARAYRHKGNHIITSAVEHPAVTEVCRFLEEDGARVTYLQVDEYGMVDPRLLEDAITPQTILISIMHANNEVGTLEPIAEIAAIARARGVIMHTDCAQSVGKVPVTVNGLGVDLLSIAGHKVYAPKGVGALYIRTGVKVARFMHGADHEMKRRAGTENVIEIVGLGKACEIVSLELDAHAKHMKRMRDRFEERIKAGLPGVRINGHPEMRLPNTSSLSFQGLEANTILSELEGVAASAGAACHAEGVDVSSVLEAMNVPVEYAMGTVRISVGRSTTEEDIDKAADDLLAVVIRLRSGKSPEGEGGAGEEIRLTQYTHGLGCACKLRPQVLEQVLEKLPRPLDSNVLVGADTSDDAAVYRVDEKTAIVQTVDFFTPVVDDPFQFGAIAAANSLSDIYAMGARPIFALSIVGFPSNRLPVEVLKQIISGALSKTDEAGITIIGGHTVDDNEPKFGLAVSGLAEPGRVVTNRGAMPGDVLILTKPLGTGILSTALKRGLLDRDQTRELVELMSALNRDAAEAMQETGVSACTDITGFGLLGHLREMMDSSRTSAVISAGQVPLLGGALQLATSGIVPGGTVNNREYTAPSVSYDDGVPEVLRVLLNDAQTSGGLLISVPGGKAGSLMALLGEKGVKGAAIVGSVEGGRDSGLQGVEVTGGPPLIRVTP
jgi:cysteine desulfurase NifS/selenium donor protein